MLNTIDIQGMPTGSQPKHNSSKKDDDDEEKQTVLFLRATPRNIRATPTTTMSEKKSGKRGRSRRKCNRRVPNTPYGKLQRPPHHPHPPPPPPPPRPNKSFFLAASLDDCEKAFGWWLRFDDPWPNRPILQEVETKRARSCMELAWIEFR